jgi:hypothetical protein
MRKWLSRWRAIGWTVAGIIAVTSLSLRVSGQSSDPFVMVGTQGLGKQVFPRMSARTPRINVLEVDVWRHSLEDGSLSPIAKVPFSPHDLIRTEHFSPDYYQKQIQQLDDTYARQRDVLMYFGGIPASPHRHGLNFNGWGIEDLQRLRAAGSRPFIGLETMDPTAVEWMAQRLHDAGYGPLNRIYIRICSEPSGSSYGSDDGTAGGTHHTVAAYAAYRRRFASVATQLHEINHHYGLDMHTVFAGANAEDFKSYIPSNGLFDELGYDLYVTPENKENVLRQIVDLRHRFPWKPIVIPEFGIATAGPGASPIWARDALGDILMQLGRHPAGVAGVTIFSVNVSGRLPHKRWNWAWTPMMFKMLKEWQLSSRHWRREGFHRYDPLSYSVGRDVLYLDRSDLRIVYRKLATSKAPGVPYFHEVRLWLDRNRWVHRERTITSL